MGASSAFALSINSVLYIMRLNTEMLSYLFWRFNGSIHIKYCCALRICEFALRSVSGLDKTSCPSTVFFTVRSIIVDTIKRCSFGFFSHIGNKVCDVMPAFTNKNTSSAISRIFCVFRFITSCHHARPRWVQSVIPKTVLAINIRSFLNAFKRVFDDCWVAMPVPSKVVLSAKLAGQPWAGTVGHRAMFHERSIAQNGTFEKTKGVASK